jgi:DNA-binding NtrC family response regulator
LVVDDDENFRTMLLDLLETSDYMAQGVEDSETALALLREVNFDLLMVDLRMPGMGGIELIRQVRSLYPHARVIILTGYAGKESAIEAASLGVADTMEKPIRNLRALESAVEFALSHQPGGPSTEAGDRNSSVTVTRRLVRPERDRTAHA